MRKRRPKRLVFDRLEVRTMLSGDVGAAALDLTPGHYAPDRILVGWQDGFGPQGSKGYQVVQLPAGMSVEQAVRNYSALPGVRYAEPDYLYRPASVPNDPYFTLQYALRNTGQSGGTAGADINATAAWDITTGSSDVIVAVIDTGTDITHTDLASNIWTNPGEIPGNSIDDDGNGYVDDVHGWDFVDGDNDPQDDDGHGTHVAGIIGASTNNSTGVAGINWTSAIMPLRVIGPDSTSSSDVVSAIQYAVANGASIINMSFESSDFSQALSDAIDAAVSAGVLIVASAGNNSTDNDATPQYPASYASDGIISVMATDRSDAVAGFSNYGATSVDIAAPGVSVLSITPGDTYSFYSGTSQAAAMVSGVAALIKAQHPELTPAEIRARILNSADPVSALDGMVVSGGRLDAFRALSNPTVGGAVSGQAVADNATISPFSTLTVADYDTPSPTLQVDVQISDPANGAFTTASLTASGFADQGGGLYRFSGTADLAQAAIRQLVFAPTTGQVAVGQTVTTTFTVTADDGNGNSDSNALTTVIATAAGDPPILGGALADQAVDDNATLGPFAGFTITDADSPAQSLTVTVELSDSSNGFFTPASLTASGFGDSGNGLYSFVGTAAEAQAAIRQLVFLPTVNQVAPGDTVTTTFTVTVDDGIELPTIDSTTTVVATSINDAPTIGGTAADQAVDDDATILPFAGVLIADADRPSQSLTVTVELSDPANGAFTTASLTASGFGDSGNGLYSFNGTADQAQAALRQLVFAPTSDQAAVGDTVTTTFTLGLDDGIALPVTDSTTTVVATSVNSAPVLGGAEADQPVSDSGTILPFAGFTIVDGDAPAQQLVVTVELDHPENGGFTALSLADAHFSEQSPGLYAFEGTAAEAQAAIRQLIFAPTMNQVAPGSSVTTTFTVTADDGLATPVSDSTTTVVATSINDVPVLLGGVSGQPVSDSGTISPFASFEIRDADGATQSLTVTVELSDPANGGFTPDSLTASGFSDQGGGSYRFAGTPEEAQAAIRLLVFASTINQVAPGSSVTTTFTVTADDGIATPVSDSTTTVVASSINDTPVLGGGVADQSLSDTATILPFATFTIADADSPAQTLTVDIQLSDPTHGGFTAASLSASGFADQGGGLYRFSGTAAESQAAIRQLTFAPAIDQVAPGEAVTTTFTVTASDGLSLPVTDAETSVVATSVDDAPVLGGATSGQLLRDDAAISPFASFTVSDADLPSQMLTVEVRLSDAANGRFSAASLSASGFADVGGGLYRFSGTAADAQHALRQLVFVPTAGQVAPGQSVTTTLTVTASDGIATPVSDGTTVVIVTAVARPVDSPDALFVRGLYRDLLGREGSDAEVAGWVALIGQGLTHGDVVDGFQHSFEYLARQVNGYYRTFLGRDADDGGLQAWVQRLASGEQPGSIILGFVTSAEYQALHPTARGFVQSLYRNVLGREGEPAGVARWTRLLNAGASRRVIAQAFLRAGGFDLPGAQAFPAGPARILGGFSLAGTFARGVIR